jgi:hypothetical protein
MAGEGVEEIDARDIGSLPGGRNIRARRLLLLVCAVSQLVGIVIESKEKLRVEGKAFARKSRIQLARLPLGGLNWR